MGSITTSSGEKNSDMVYEQPNVIDDSTKKLRAMSMDSWIGDGDSTDVLETSRTSLPEFIHRTFTATPMKRSFVAVKPNLNHSMTCLPPPVQVKKEEEEVRKPLHSPKAHLFLID